MSLRVLLPPQLRRVRQASQRSFTSSHRFLVDEPHRSDDTFGFLENTTQFKSFGNAFDEIDDDEPTLPQSGNKGETKTEETSQAAPGKQPVSDDSGAKPAVDVRHAVRKGRRRVLGTIRSEKLARLVADGLKVSPPRCYRPGFVQESRAIRRKLRRDKVVSEASSTATTDPLPEKQGLPEENVTAESGSQVNQGSLHESQGPASDGFTSDTGREPTEWSPYETDSPLEQQSTVKFMSDKIDQPRKISGNGVLDQSIEPLLAKAKAAPGNRMLDRCCLITGGTSGIGLAVAKRFVEEGASRVFITTSSEERGATAIRLIKTTTGLADVPITAVVIDRSQMSSITLGGLMTLRPEVSLCNTLVNCAGVPSSSLLLSLPHAHVSEVLDVNLKTSINMAKIFLGLRARIIRRDDLHARERDWWVGMLHRAESEPVESVSPCIVNVSSLLASRGGYGASAYVAAKAGLVAFTRALCLEAATITGGGTRKPPRANVVVPGYTETRMTQGIAGEARRRLEKQIPAGRFANADEIADAVLFLVTNEYANNCVLNIDGGLSAT